MFYLFTSNPAKYWLQTLVVLALCMILVLLYKRQNLAPYYEGFTQNSRFVLKQNADIYDDFYVDIYDRLMLPDQRCAFETAKIVEMTHPSKQHSVFLDVGSGTGHLIKQLHDRGYTVYGIDQSPTMVDRVNERVPDAHVKCGNAMEPMVYERNSFTHVLCTGLTIYHFPNKFDFLRNCYFWLMPGGYLVIHLVDRDRFDTIVPGGKPPLLKSPQKYAKHRITDTIIDFVDFEYKASYKFDEAGGRDQRRVTFLETFTDDLTKNVRQNETTLYMEDVRTILQMASQCGFLVQGMATMEECGDEYQYLYILERPQSIVL